MKYIFFWTTVVLFTACATKQNKTPLKQDVLLVKKTYLKEIAPLSKTYKKGDRGTEVLKIKEWLMLWQLNANFVDVILELDTHFDAKTETLTKEVQLFLELQPTGIVDAVTWKKLTFPLREAFSIKAYDKSTMRERIKYFASKHLQFRSSELNEDNTGPWVRSYMDGKDGGLGGRDTDWAYWCQGLVCTILDQAFSSVGHRFDLYYPNTGFCEVMREHAMHNGLLVSEKELLAGEYVPQEGDIVLYLGEDGQKAHHTEIVYDVLDVKKGEMLTIGGNTNFAGSRNGVGTFLVDRNFLKDKVEIVKIIEPKRDMKQYPPEAKKLIESYPDQIWGYEDNFLLFRNGSKLLFDDHKPKDTPQLLMNSSIKDQFHYTYVKGQLVHPPARYDDPGRVTNEAFFKAMYGSTKSEVENKLKEIVWCPKLSGEKIKVTTVNQVHEKLEAISAALDEHPELKPYVSNIGGTFNWRKVAGTNRLSLHSYGIAIDLNVPKSNYWQWDCKCKGENANLKYQNRIPQLIVDIFEEHGFIWGGKWYHYDTMHFEYRPALLVD